jgi:hypothetical protein
MAKDKSFRNMNELLAALLKAEHELASGALDVEGLEVACADARELYERLVVLRHKAREAAVTPPGRAVAREEPVPEPVKPTPPDPTAIRLDTRPTDPPSRQVSLIEAIEATEAASQGTEPPPASPPEPVAATRASAPTGQKRTASTLAEKLEQAAIPDLAKAISLSHTFWFVAELFNGDRITYDKTVDLLNGLADGAAAQAYFEGEVLTKLRKPADPEALATFAELLKRRYA